MPDQIHHPAPEDAGPSSRTLKRVGVGAAVIAVAIVGIGTMTRIGATNELRTTAADAAVATVAVVSPQGADSGGALELPGNVQAYSSAAINARTNGYVRRWLADIGDSVRAGQTLAILDAPEVDQQLAQAQADYQTAVANQQLAGTTATRWRALLSQDAVLAPGGRRKGRRSRRPHRARQCRARQCEAPARSARASRASRPPFDGVVTSRSAQIGALVVAGNAAAQPLFTVSDVHRMRIYVRVPQAYSAALHPGMTATLALPEYPGRAFAATMTRSAGAVDAQSGAVLVELQADNADRALKPGAFARVSFQLGDRGATGLTLPGSTILYGSSGPSVAGRRRRWPGHREASDDRTRRGAAASRSRAASRRATA